MLLSELFDELLSYEGAIKYKNGAFVGLDPQKPLLVEFLDSPYINKIILKNEWGDVIEVKGEEVTIYKNYKKS
jgi:hypothetical protein